jgi:hypothetical protein
MSFGTIVHAIALGEPGDVVCVDAADWRAKAAKEARAEAAVAGKLACLAEEYDRATYAAYVGMALVRALLPDGALIRTETGYLWQDAPTGAWCRGLADVVHIPDPRQGRRPVVVDLKTTSATQAEWMRGVPAKYGYHVQMAAYREMVGLAWGVSPADVDYYLVVVPEEPADAWVATLSEAYAEVGEARWRRAKRVWAECCRAGVWPGPDRRCELSPPAWVLREHEEGMWND